MSTCSLCSMCGLRREKHGAVRATHSHLYLRSAKLVDSYASLTRQPEPTHCGVCSHRSDPHSFCSASLVSESRPADIRAN
ncbi:hypothetical protein INR49_001266 [Caranx melampygus]|nr:hypothetical protein INR49_001266 [Caranx melampygus]